jgi:hypothetical protein
LSESSYGSSIYKDEAKEKEEEEEEEEDKTTLNVSSDLTFCLIT